MPATSTFLSLPTEIRLQIYNHVLSTSNVHSIRPHRKVGWNRPHADLTNPALLFESDAHISLKQLFHSKLTKGDHAIILETVLHHTKVLIVDHADFAALLKIAATTTHGSNTSSLSMAQAGRSMAAVVRENLRTMDFSDRMDEIVCQPNDIVKLVRGLPGLRTIHLTSKHVQRYSGTVEEHVDFARERAEREFALDGNIESTTQTQDSPCANNAQVESRFTAVSIGRHSDNRSTEDSISELRRLSLRSPMTDGTRMMISPALLSRSIPTSGSNDRSISNVNVNKDTWVVVDLSMLVWQHFLYTGAPYRDHWRTIKMSTLLDIAARKKVHVVLTFRNIEFDPSRRRQLQLSLSTSTTGHPSSINFGGSTGSASPRVQQTQPQSQTAPSTRPYTPTRRSSQWELNGLFKGEMSTADWTLRLRQVGRAPGSGGSEYTVRQRRMFDEAVRQEGCGLVRCRHSTSKFSSGKMNGVVSIGVNIGGGAVCEECAGA